MKILKQTDYQRIRTWIYRNARPLDLALWKYLYEDGKREEVVDALVFYQNEDGGFGNGIEPDCWNTQSSPYATLFAAGILRQIAWIEDKGLDNPVVQGIFRYFESGIHENREGWFFCIPSNDSFPRAPWWTYSEESNHIQGLGVTAGICSFVIHYGQPETGLYKKVWSHTEQVLKRARETEDFGEMGAGGVCQLLEELMQKGLIARFNTEGLMEKMGDVVNRSIERDPEKWQYYTPGPSVFIDSPENPLYKGNEEIVDLELDYIIDTRNPDGVWNITWSWFDLCEIYGKEFAVSENWWKSMKAIEKVKHLKNFGRLEM